MLSQMGVFPPEAVLEEKQKASVFRDILECDQTINLTRHKRWVWAGWGAAAIATWVRYGRNGARVLKTH